VPPKIKALVLDSWAVIAFFEDEPAGKKIADLIANAHEDRIPVFMTVVNVGEVWYITAREISEEAANNIVKELSDLRIEFVDVNWEITQEAARFKSRNRMSYADCYAAALTRSKKGVLVTGDSEFKAIDGQIDIQWV
jgi:predicted nucleic acid-binding protein